MKQERKVFISPTNPHDLFPGEEFTQKKGIYYNDSKVILSGGGNMFSSFNRKALLELEEEDNRKISKRKVFISSSPYDLFPDEKFTQKNGIYYNDNKIIIRGFDFFSLMAILELEEQENGEISKKMKKFFDLLNASERSIETLLATKLSPIKRRRLILIIGLVVNTDGFEECGNDSWCKNTTRALSVVGCTKRYIEKSNKEIDLEFKKQFLNYVSARKYATTLWKPSRTTKTPNGYRTGILKTNKQNLTLVEKSFIDLSERRIHLELLIILVKGDQYSIFLSIKPKELDAIEILRKNFREAEGYTIQGNSDFARLVTLEPEKDSKKLLKFFESNY